MRVGLFPDGRPGELFIDLQRTGGALKGLLNAFAIAVSASLQYGVPLTDLIRKFIGQRFEPSGVTGNPHIPIAESIIDYIFRWLEIFTKQPKPKHD